MPKLHSINLLATRAFDIEFGDLKKALSVLGYKTKFVDLGCQATVEPDVELELSCLTELQNSLREGAVITVPSFLEATVRFYQLALTESNIQGVFVPPTTSGAMFQCMVKHIDSYLPKVDMADDTPWNTKEMFPALITEASIILAARTLSIPVFGSCHGAQLLWYMHGGELYSLPQYTTTEEREFNMSSGMLLNPGHASDGIYHSEHDTAYQDEDGYESDPDEEPNKDYNHNLLMITTKSKWRQFNAKMHPNMQKGRLGFFPSENVFCREEDDWLPELEKEQVVARSFTFPGLIATQWHPHKSLATKSAIRYLHLFARACSSYQPEPHVSPTHP